MLLLQMIPGANAYAQPGNVAGMGLSGVRVSPVNMELNVDGMTNLGSSRLLYSQVNGSPFLTDAFNSADVFSRDNKFLGNYPVRFNLASEQFHFLNEASKEYVVPESLVGKIVMKEGLGQFRGGEVFTNCINGISMNGIKVDKFVQVLVEGEASLYKYSYRRVISKENSLKPNPDYYFATLAHYFINVAGTIKYIKKFNASGIRELLPERQGMSRNAGAYNFKNEAELIGYINDWNLASSKKIK